MDINAVPIQMTGFPERVEKAEVKENEVALFWLGQAGFLFKTHKGQKIAIDPYLTNQCEPLCCFRRLMLPIASPEEFSADVILLSHEHEDHLDLEMLDRMAKAENLPALYGTGACEKKLQAYPQVLKKFRKITDGELLSFGEFTLYTLRADHGAMAPDALGFILDFGFKKVYFAGDTAYTPEMLKTAYDMKPEVALLPINGEYGNLNGKEAAKLADDIKAKLLIPCHFWTFVEHGACPIELVRAQDLCPDTKIRFLAQGDGFVLGR